MRRWRYTELGDDGQPVERVVTEAEILATYYPWWCEQMRKVHKDDQVSEPNCIDDWVVVHWAWENQDS